MQSYSFTESFSHFDGGAREIPPHASATAQIFATYLPEHISAISAVGDQVNVFCLIS